MCSSPPITVLMPVYNGEAFLADAIDSILNQSFKDFEFLIIDDGSTDNSAKIIKSYDEPRIRFVQNPENLKLIKTLNKGLALAKGDYIARMDCDDISHPDRLNKQYRCFADDPSIAVIATNVTIKQENGQVVGPANRPVSALQNRWRLLFDNPIMHPTTMFRKQYIMESQGYARNAVHAEDYDLWARLAAKWQVIQLPDVLVTLTKHDANIGLTYQKEQIETSMAIARQTIHNTFPDLVLHDTDNMVKQLWNEKLPEEARLEAYGDFFRLLAAFYVQFTPDDIDNDWITQDFINKVSPLFREKRLIQQQLMKTITTEQEKRGQLPQATWKLLHNRLKWKMMQEHTKRLLTRLMPF